jgi:hypothetical protein
VAVHTAALSFAVTPTNHIPPANGNISVHTQFTSKCTPVIMYYQSIHRHGHYHWLNFTKQTLRGGWSQHSFFYKYSHAATLSKLIMPRGGFHPIKTAFLWTCFKAAWETPGNLSIVEGGNCNQRGAVHFKMHPINTVRRHDQYQLLWGNVCLFPFSNFLSNNKQSKPRYKTGEV